jgi:hypothetical protein
MVKVSGGAVAGLALGAALLGAAAPAAAAVVVAGGQTSVALDTEALASAASLALSGVSADTIAPGALGDGSVAFAINPPDAQPPALPTTFGYDPADPLATLSGAIEHTGSVFFNDGSVEVGNFTIGADFTVADTVSGLGVLFDAVPDLSTIVADDERLFVEGDLLVASAFASFLEDNGLSEVNLGGVDVGDFQVDATVVPLPGAVLFLASGVAGLAGMRFFRRRTAAPA